MDLFDDDNDKRRRKNLFDSTNEKEFEQIFKEMKRMFKSSIFQEMIEKMFHDSLDSNKHSIHSLNINILPIVRLKSEHYSGCPLKNPQEKKKSSVVNKPLPDIIKADKEITVTIEIINVVKKDIDINATENTLEIIVNNPKRKYHKLLNLPCSVKPKTVKFTYKNGILDIVIKRKKKGSSCRQTI